MTIKRRLFISNILMIVLPVALFWLVLAVLSIVLFGSQVPEHQQPAPLHLHSKNYS
jgi:hypothetical protein